MTPRVGGVLRPDPHRFKLLPRLEGFVDRLTIPKIPAAWADQDPTGTRYPMDDNNADGNCVVAWMYHQIESQWRRHHGNEGAGTPTDLVGTAEQANAVYWSIAGISDPAQQVPPGPGLDPVNACVYWKSTGIPVGTETNFAEGACSIGLTSLPLLRWASYSFAGIGLALELPDDWQTSYQAPGPWQATGAPNPSNGHMTGIFGYGPQGFLLPTWGGLRWATPEFVQAYGQYALAVLTSDWWSIPGLDCLALECALHSLGGWPVMAS